MSTRRQRRQARINENQTRIAHGLIRGLPAAVGRVPQNPLEKWFVRMADFREFQRCVWRIPDRSETTWLRGVISAMIRP